MIEYFPHDYNARNDPKLTNLLMEMGYEGIGIYWSFEEYLYEQGGFIMQSDCKGIAFALRMDLEKLEKVILLAFTKKDEKIFSKAVLYRLEKREEKSDKASASAKKRWKYQDELDNANAMRTHSENDANAMLEEKRREENKKEDNNSIEEYKPFEEIVRQTWNLFSEKYPTLSKIKEITGTRRKHLKERFEKESFRDFNKIILAIEQQPFLIHGSQSSGKHDNWRVSFDWLIANDTNYVKVLEMKYIQTKSIELEQPKIDNASYKKLFEKQEAECLTK
jgi:hypothetical protein